MSLDMLGQLNWLAVVVGGLAYFVLGALWFARPVFGRAWRRSVGWDDSRPDPAVNPATYVIPLLAFLVMGAATGMLAAATGSSDLNGGITLGLVLGVGYALARTAVDATFSPNTPHPWVWFAISGGYHLVGVLVMTVIIVLWQ